MNHFGPIIDSIQCKNTADRRGNLPPGIFYPVAKAECIEDNFLYLLWQEDSFH